MITTKSGSKFIFSLDDGTTVQYDLATKQTIGKRGGIVKNLKSQLGGLSCDDIIETIEPEGYRDFLRYVRRQNSRDIYNFGTLLELAKGYSRFEQFFVAGITDFENNINIKFSDIPKGLLKLLRENPVRLTDTLYRCYVKYPDMFTLLTKESYTTLTVEDGIKILLYGWSTWRYRDGVETPDVVLMAEKWNYNMKSLLHYIDELMSYEALKWDDAIHTLYDYARMSATLSPKFEKYPRYLHTTHDITVRNYNRLKETHSETDFAKTVKPEFNTIIDEYIFTCAKTQQEIKDEAVQQNNCVASYISSVIAGSCHILFMRKKDFKDKSLITLEERDYQIVQSRGKYNRDLTDKEKNVLAKYERYLAGLKEDTQIEKVS